MMKVIKEKEKIFKKIKLRIKIDELETFGSVKGLPRRGNSTGYGYPYPSLLFLFNLIIKSMPKTSIISLINVFNKFIFYFYTKRPFLLFTISIPYVFIISLNKFSLKIILIKGYEIFRKFWKKSRNFLNPLGS
jgi:hypothetical protein